jgi:hypothetical protein
MLFETSRSASHSTSMVSAWKTAHMSLDMRLTSYLGQTNHGRFIVFELPEGASTILRMKFSSDIQSNAG